ncbi:acetoacetate metabolism regulatory protein AtoC ornithine/argininedecarboxylase inhibitor, ornithinedecarboxylase antizyme [groundwater metagenome]
MNLNENKGRILIVDDEEIVHKTLKRLLRDEGYTIDSAYGGEEALSMLENDYDLIICDIRMPGIDGIEVLRQVKKRELPVEVVMLTGYATLESATRALNYGARSYLMKPIENIPAFMSMVSEAVHTAQITQENKEFYKALMSGQVDSLVIDGKPTPVPALRKEIKEILQRLLEVIKDGVVVLDFDGVITFANINFAQMMGESYQNMLSRRFDSYIPEDERGG